MKVYFNEEGVVVYTSDEEVPKTYDEKDMVTFNEEIGTEFITCLYEIVARGSGRKLMNQFDSLSGFGDYINEDDYYYYIYEMNHNYSGMFGDRKLNSDEIEASLMLLAIIQAKRRLKERKELEGTIGTLKEEISNLQKKLNGRQFQIDQVKSGKAKPAYRDDITPEKVQVLYDKLKNKCAVARELKVDRRLVDRRLNEMQKRNGGGKKQ